MDPLSALVAAGGAAALAVPFVIAARRRGRARAWRAAARRVGLAEVAETPGRRLSGPVLTGRSGQLSVRLEDYRRGKYESVTRILISGLEHGAEALSLKAEGIGTRLFGSEIEVGDPELDRQVYVQGPAPLALALLDAATRQRVVRLLCRKQVGNAGKTARMSAVLDRGVLEVDLRDSPFDLQGEQVYQALKEAIATARRLVAPADLPAALADNLPHEPAAGVRLQLVLALAREFPGHPQTRRALLAARRDRSDEVRLRAALALGDEGHETLVELAEGTAIEGSCAARAVAALGDRLAAGRVKVRLERALAVDCKRTAQACIESLARRGDASIEGLLLRALHDRDLGVALTAARALGQVGTVAAVAPLREQASTLLPSALRSAARQAIAEIQSRLAARQGQLALAGGEAGALSLAAHEAGGLSLAAEGAPPEGSEREAAP